MQQRRARLERRFRIDDDGQRLPLDVDQIATVLGDVGRRRDDHGDRLADEASLVGRHTRCSGARSSSRMIPLGTNGNRSAKSAPVNTATTPSTASAADVSIETIRACA